jgi:hypothetical protein
VEGREKAVSHRGLKRGKAEGKLKAGSRGIFDGITEGRNG